MLNKFLAAGARNWLPSLLLTLALSGCLDGGASAPEESPPRHLSRTIDYKALTGQMGGNILRPAIGGVKDWGKCDVSPCLSSFTQLLTKAAFQDYVTQSSGRAETKPDVLAAGNEVDFAQEQIWAFKYGSLTSPELDMVRLEIRETETRFEVRANICSPLALELAGGFDAFVIMPFNLAPKPVVILDNTYICPVYG